MPSATPRATNPARITSGSPRTAANQTIGVEIAREVQRRELHARYRRGKISFTKFKRQLRRLRVREP